MAKIRAGNVVVTGLAAGTLDALAAVIQYLLRGGNDPAVVFRFIASGVFGSRAFQGGFGMVLSGILLHYLIATIWTLIFFLLYPRIPGRWRNTYVLGVIYGIFVWIGMNLIVLPLSKTPAIEHTLPGILTSCAILILAVGLPISIMYSRFHPDKQIGQ